MSQTPHALPVRGQEAYAAWMLHCVPDSTPACAPCLDAELPDGGCAEGSRLYAEWADARKLPPTRKLPD